MRGAPLVTFPSDSSPLYRSYVTAYESGAFPVGQCRRNRFEIYGQG